MPTRNTTERFWSLVDMTVNDECWLWQGARTAITRDFQYGQFSLEGKQWLAHRLSYTLAVGAIPDGLVIDHLCRTPLCVRPAHLEAVDNWTNVIGRGEGLLARRARATHCQNGHEWNDTNTWMRPGARQPTRACRACARERMRARRSRRAHVGGRGDDR